MMSIVCWEDFPLSENVLMNWINNNIIDIINRSGLRGRGGAGFPTGRKWRISLDSDGDHKYVVCNGDEGDPGAFMDRMLLESFPYRVIEGMIIAGYAQRQHEGYFISGQNILWQ